MNFWANQRFVVTGGAGFLGSFVVDGLRARGAEQIFVPRSSDYDLRQREAVLALLNDTQPAKFFHDNCFRGLTYAQSWMAGNFPDRRMPCW